jgi:hypothetical protein
MMRGLQLYLTEVDELELVKAAFEEGCRLIPDCHYETAEYRELRSITEFKHHRAHVRHFFILGAGDELPRGAMRRVEKETESFFYLSPNVGEPSLELLGGGVFTDEESGKRMVRPGFLEFSQYYWTPDLSRRMVSPPEIEERFKRLASVVKRHSIRIKPGKGVFWLGNDAKLQLENGASLVGYEEWSQGSLVGHA